MSISSVHSGLIYRNPKPHLESRHAYFPSLAVLRDGTLFAAFDLGSAFEAVDVRSHYALSHDGGMTWTAPIAVPLPSFPEPFSGTCRFRCSPDGALVGVGALWDRTRLGEGLANPETGGFVETHPFLIRSEGGSMEWSKPAWLKAPLPGPFEICAPVCFAPNGDWLWPASTWKDWAGHASHGMHAIVLRSSDQGRSWPAWNAVMDGRREDIIHWEIKLIGLSDGRLLAVSWTHDAKTATDLSIHYALSSDSGCTFTAPRPTGLHGQTCTPLALQDGRILSVYRRTDQPGLWVQISRLDGDNWIDIEEELLWGGASHAAGATNPRSATTAMSSLRFGLPASVLLSDGSVFVAFWCVEDAVSVIRFFKIYIND